jgi:TRAP-type C4-dicarboxylate transport system permease small subunit
VLGRLDTTAPHDSRWPKRFARALEGVLSILAAILMLAVVLVVLAGVLSRFVLKDPLSWSDELASIFFLWLAMCGAAIALSRGQHMRMTAVIARISPGWLARSEALATAVSLAFLLLILIPTWQFAMGEYEITTPALGISNVWRAIALPIGVGVMALSATLQLLTLHSLKQMLAVSMLIIVVGSMFWIFRRTFDGFGNYNLLIFFGAATLFCVFAGVPIAFAFGLGTFGYLVLGTGIPLEG